jgi:hypothetical protein
MSNVGASLKLLEVNRGAGSEIPFGEELDELELELDELEELGGGGVGSSFVASNG